MEMNYTRFSRIVRYPAALSCSNLVRLNRTTIQSASSYFVKLEFFSSKDERFDKMAGEKNRTRHVIKGLISIFKIIVDLVTEKIL